MPNNIDDAVPQPPMPREEFPWNRAAFERDRNILEVDIHRVAVNFRANRVVHEIPAGPAENLFEVPVIGRNGEVIDWVRRLNDAPVHMDELPYADLVRIEHERQRAGVGALRVEPAPGRDVVIKSGWGDFDKTVHEVFQRNAVSRDKSETIIGLELENETLQEFPLPRVSGWQHHQEGSLRNFGFEYVQAMPKSVPDSLVLCSNMLKYLKKNAEPQELLNSSRTSTHVHFDVGHYSFKDIMTFACTYWILEEYLSSFCGATRKGNLYCLRLKDSSAIQVLIKSAIAEGAPWGIPLHRNDYRYASLNFASLPKFGTLEFRMMSGTDRLEDIETWVNTLDAVKKFALRFSNPTELGQFFIKKCEARQFPRTVLGSELAHKITSKIGKTPSEIETEVRSGFMMVYPILAAHGTWDFTKEVAEEAIRLRKEKEEKAREVEEALRYARRVAAILVNPPVPEPQQGQDEMPDNIEDAALVDLAAIGDE